MIKERVLIFVIILIFIGVFCFSINKYYSEDKGFIIKDVGRIYSAEVKEVIYGKETQILKDVIVRANEKNLKVSISGKKHSQGGHTFYDDALVLDMTSYNKILNLDKENKIITVQSGVTWEDIQTYINPYNLSIEVMQSSNIFTVGGSLSVNAHGRDPNYGSIIETVISFRLLLANGTIINVNRRENPELFSLVIGGYGLFGVILDVDLELTENVAYEKHTELMEYTEYPEFFLDNVRNKKDVGLHFARLSIVKDDLFLRETYVTTYYKTDNSSIDWNLKSENNIFRDKFFYGLSRKYDWGKELRWKLQKDLVDKPGEIEFVSRNNAMRPPIKFLEYYSSSNTDILQEYYIPSNNFINFTDDLRKIVIENDINLLSTTIRYIPENNESYLSYSKNDYFAFVLAINQGLSEKEVKKAEKWTQELVNVSISNGGTYYLTYQLYPTQEQIRVVYPEIDRFFDKKKEYDSNQIFMNKFYSKYALGEEDE